MNPILEQVGKDFADQLKIVKLDVDQNPNTTAAYSIRSLPTFLIFKDGAVIDKFIGGMPKSHVIEKLTKHIDQ